MSFHVISCHVILCHFMSCHVMSFHVMSCHFKSYHVSFDFSDQFLIKSVGAGRGEQGRVKHVFLGLRILIIGKIFELFDISIFEILFLVYVF
jgi:uncharacterized membrane protein YjdF